MPVPPPINKPKTVFGIDFREVLIISICLILGLVIVFLIPGPFYIRLFAGILLVLIGVGMALGRDPATGKPVELIVLDFIRFAYRPRYYRRGSAGSGFNQYSQTGQSSQRKNRNVGQSDVDEQQDFYPVDRPKPMFTYEPFPLGLSFFFSIFSTSFLITFVVWLWFGGANQINDLLNHLHP